MPCDLPRDSLASGAGARRTTEATATGRRGCSIAACRVVELRRSECCARYGDWPHAASVAFGQRLRELRAERGVSQDDLADKTDVHPTAIGRLERGKREPRLSTILRLARGLDVDPGELLNDLRSTS